VALVVFLRGVNVGGHRTLRPAALARQLAHLDAVNIGAAGTFLIRKRIARARLRAELSRALPFDAHIVICGHREIVRIVSRDHFRGERVRPHMVRFVSVLSRVPRSAPATPITIPSQGRWLVKVVARESRFLIGLYRREMKTIGCLGALDRIFGTPAITRNWNTIGAVARALDREPAS
jgi:uncharacterized protein (DUF1697 family)